MLVRDVENAYFDIINKENIGLAEKFSVNPCYCTNNDFYKDYLHFSAIHDLNTGNTVTHVFIDEDAQRIMGYISLRSNSIISKNNEGNIVGKPALEISVLAVDKDYERRGVGTLLMSKAIEIASVLHREYAGIKYLVLTADAKAVGFYKKMDFHPIETQWEQIPAESFSSDCIPMCRDLQFELENLECFADDEDDDDWN